MGFEYKNGMFDLKEVFGNDNDVVLEIGFGMGKLLVEMVKNVLEFNFIGIEVYCFGVGVCLMDVDEVGIINLCVFEYDVVEVFVDCIVDESLFKL